MFNPTPRGEVWGVCLGGSRPTPKGEVEGSGQGGSSLTPGGGSRSRPRGCIPACTEADTPQQTATVAGGTHPTGMHSCN